MVSFKTVLRSFGTTIVCFCAAFLAFLFQGFRLDLIKLDTTGFNEYQTAWYNAQISQSKVMNAVSAGILTAFAIITLVFSIIRFVNENQGNMGVMKAMGYSRIRISLSFMKFGINTFIGTTLAYLFSLAFNPVFYQEMNSTPGFPEVECTFHPILWVYIILIPTLLFTLFSFLIAYFKLGRRPLEMIKGIDHTYRKKTKEKKTFLKTLKSNILHSHISLVLFVGFSSLCFGSTVQMSFSMKQLGTSDLFFWLMFGIGLLLGVTILILAFGFTYQGNKKYLSFLKAYGYNDKECVYALYGGYVLVTIIGFVLGCVYQYFLLRVMVNIFSDVGVSEYHYSFPGLGYTLLIFVPFYLLTNLFFFYQIKKQSLKEVAE